MRILFVPSYYPTDQWPEYCVFLEQQAQALKDQGEDVEILHFAPDGDGWRKGLRVHRLDLALRKRDLLALNRGAKRKLRGFPWWEYDVVSMQFGPVTVLSYVARCCEIWKVPVTMTYHGLNVWEDYDQKRDILHRTYYALKRRQKRRMLRRVRTAIGVSDLVCREIRRGAPWVRTETVYNGVDPEKFYPGEQERRDKFRILCVGNLTKIKGQVYLRRAAGELAGEGRSFCLTLIGDGPERENLQALCGELGIEGMVIFLGVQPYEAVACWMRESDLFLLPSFFEAFGCVYLEAMSSGVLACGCQGTGAEEILRDNGLLVKQRDVEEIKNAIRFAMDCPEEARVLARAGRSRAGEFSWEASARKLREVYRTCLEGCAWGGQPGE